MISLAYSKSDWHARVSSLKPRGACFRLASEFNSANPLIGDFGIRMNTFLIKSMTYT